DRRRSRSPGLPSSFRRVRSSSSRCSPASGGTLVRTATGPARSLLRRAHSPRHVFPSRFSRMSASSTHTSLFWVAVLVACAVDGYWTASRIPRAVVAAGAAVYVASLGIGQHANLTDMRATGERARVWLSLISSTLRPVPDGALVVFRASGAYKA